MKIRLKGAQSKQMQPWERVKQRFYQARRKGSRREERTNAKDGNSRNYPEIKMTQIFIVKYHVIYSGHQSQVSTIGF